MMKIFLLLILFEILVNINCFNLSPKPNLILTEPKLASIQVNQSRSSYFGFSLNLRHKSLFIGAPRAQSTLESQRDLNETGAIYKCTFKPNSNNNSESCAPYYFETSGDNFTENILHNWYDERRSNQWLGASMDGGANDRSPLVVCAPRFRTGQGNSSFGMHGICYYTENAASAQPKKILKIQPLLSDDKQTGESETNNQTFFRYLLAQQGISVHWIEKQKEIIIGAPGINDGSGSIIRYNILKRISHVPNPINWRQPTYSYFGYAVSSGNFYVKEYKSFKLLYLASAPKNQTEQVYLFEIKWTIKRDLTTRKHQVFAGTKLGEYFGYCVITGDYNGDRSTDIIVSAPFHGIDDSYEVGAIYVFLNIKGTLNFKREIIVPTSRAPGRFGTAIANLGDINHDGYNDLAVGAPFDGDGVVYIYLGSKTGLDPKHIQILAAPNNPNLQYPQMFGHGLSKGVDIDSNAFNDIAIGAPNADTVYVYRAYPVLYLNASIRLAESEITTNMTTVKLIVCYQTEQRNKLIERYLIKMTVVVDEIYQRFKFMNTTNSTMILNNLTVANEMSCRDFNVSLAAKITLMKLIFKSVNLEAYYDIEQQIPQTTNEFCQQCAIINPAKPKFIQSQYKFKTLCNNADCLKDMKVTTSVNSTILRGSSRYMTIIFEIRNKGEPAYQPQINITSSNQIPFAKLPPNCRETDFVLFCDLLQGQPMYDGTVAQLEVTFDIDAVEDQFLNITAQVFSYGNELNENDNLLSTIIEFIEFSNIHAIGTTTDELVNIEDWSGYVNYTHEFVIGNLGPTSIRQIEVIIFYPISCQFAGITNQHLKFISRNDLLATANYNSFHMNLEFDQPNRSTDILNTIEIDRIAAFDEIELEKDTNLTDLEKDFDFENTDENITDLRVRRSIQDFNVVLPQKEQQQSVIDINPSQTIILNCSQPNVKCAAARFHVVGFQAISKNPISITINFTINLNKLEELIREDTEYIVIQPDIQTTKLGDEKSQTINVIKTLPSNYIRIVRKEPLPIWIYVISIMAGLLLLILITYGLYRFGFFKRAKKEEMETYKRNSQIIMNRKSMKIDAAYIDEFEDLPLNEDEHEDDGDDTNDEIDKEGW